MSLNTCYPKDYLQLPFVRVSFDLGSKQESWLAWGYHIVFIYLHIYLAPTICKT